MLYIYSIIEFVVEDEGKTGCWRIVPKSDQLPRMYLHPEHKNESYYEMKVAMPESFPVQNPLYV